MILSNATNISDIKLAGSSICGALQNSTQAIFWGYGSTTVSRVLSGSIALYKYGAGTVTLSSANSYTNGTFLAEGTVILSNNAGIGTSGNITFTGGGLRYLSGVTRDIASRIKNSTSPVTITIDSSASQSWSGVMDSSNTGGFTKRGTGNLTLTSSHTLTGPLTLREGNVYFQQPNVFSEVRLVRGVGGISLGSTNKVNGFGSGTIYFQLETGPGFPDGITFDSSGVTTGPMTIANNVSADMIKGRGVITFFGNKGAVLSSNITLTGTGTTAFANTTTTTTNSNQLTFASVPSLWVVGTYLTGTGVPGFTQITLISGNTITTNNVMSVNSGTSISGGSGDFVLINNQTGGNTLTFSGAVTGSTYVGAFSLRGGNIGNDGIFTGYVNFPAGGGIAHNGVNWWTIYYNANNNYGRLSVQNAATNAGIRFGDDNCIPSTALLQWANLSGSSIDLNGKSATCAGLSGTSGAANIGNLLVNSSLTPSTLTLAGLNTTRSFFGTTSGQINVILNSPSRLQQLYSINNHTGTTQVVAGTLSVSSTAGGALSKLSVAALSSSQLSATFSSTPASTEVFKLFNGSTVNSYASVSLTGAPGLTGYYNSSTSTIGFVPAATSVTTGLVTSQLNALTIPVSANPNGLQAGSAASVSVEYGSTPSLGLTSTPVSIGTGTVSILSTHQLSGLTANTLYYYRARVSNVLWTVNSSTTSASTLAGLDPFWSSVVFLQNFDTLTLNSTPSPITNQNSAYSGNTLYNQNWTIQTAPIGAIGQAIKSGTVSNDAPYSALSAPIVGEYTIECSLYCNKFMLYNGQLTWDGAYLGELTDTINLNGSGRTGVYFFRNLTLNVFELLVLDTTGGTKVISSSVTPQEKTWYDLAASRDASGNVYFFINGTLIGTTTLSSSVKPNFALMWISGINPSAQNYVDDFRITNACRYTSNYTVSRPFPVG